MKKLLLMSFSLLTVGLGAQNGFTTYTTNASITGTVKKETALLVDNFNNKWIGFNTIGISPNAGLLKYDNAIWTLYNTTSTPALPSNSVTALAKDNSGNIWIGTNVGLVKFDGISFTTYNTANGLPTNTINCIDIIGSQVYVGTSAGLSRFDGVNFTNYNVSNGKLPVDYIKSIKAESSGLIWIGSANRLIEFSIDGTFTNTSYIDHSITNTPGDVNCIFIDSQNTKWLGTTNVGVLKYTGTSFVNANSLYVFFGGVIPNKVLDITQGVNNGVALKMVKLAADLNSIGVMELAPNNVGFQYFAPTTYSLGDFVENNGSDFIISQGGTAVSSKIYSVFDKANYQAQLGTVNSDNFKTLDINNVRAGIANRGDMHWDIAGTGNALYEVPKGSGINSNFASALWIGGYDAGNQLHIAAQTYRQNGVDFWPGPLDTIAGTIDTTTSKQFDKIWKVSYTDINDFITNFNNGNVQNHSYTPSQDILTWPAHGSGSYSRNLAPFVDYNADGIYNPMDGDYPKIKGDQTLYFIYNDNLNTHQASGGTQMGLEIQGMAYAYGCPTSTNGNPELNLTTFYDYKITNRSATNYHNVYTTFWSDVDLGNYNDDYIGSNVTENFSYGYNADSDDASGSGVNGYGAYMPAQGFAIMKGPLANAADGIDNDNDGTVDEIGEECKLNKLTFFNNSLAGTPVQTTDPANAQEYFNYMTGLWKDGSPFTCGGNAYGGTTPTSWVYAGNPNTGLSTESVNTCGFWTEASASNTPSDRRLLMSSGPFNLSAGQSQHVEYALVTSFDSTQVGNNIAAIAKLKTDIQNVRTFYNQINKPNCLQSINVGVKEVLKSTDFNVYPNPSKSVVNVVANLEGVNAISYELVDVLGKQVLQNRHTGSQFLINVSDLKLGVYFLRLQVNESVVVKKIVKE